MCWSNRERAIDLLIWPEYLSTVSNASDLGQRTQRARVERPPGQSLTVDEVPREGPFTGFIQPSRSKFSNRLFSARCASRQTGEKMKRHRFQYGCLTKRSHRLSEDVWQFRFYETTAEGQRYRRSRTIGTLAQYPTRSDALIQAIELSRLRLNLGHRFGRPITVRPGYGYIEHELSRRGGTQHDNLTRHPETLDSSSIGRPLLDSGQAV